MAKQGEELREEIAMACRILGQEIGSTGHVSARISDTEMYLRCRGDNEAGLLYANTPSVRRMELDGKGPMVGAYRIPHEMPLHGEIYRNRPDVEAVVHVHPYNVLLCGLAGVEFRPIFGGYQPPTLRIALQGVPVYDRVTQTITTRELAQEMCDAMGDHDLILLAGHGAAAVGTTVQAATMLAIRFEHLAQITWQLVLAGKYDSVRETPEIDRIHYSNYFSRDSGGGDEGGGWGRYINALEATVGLPSSVHGDD